MARPLVQTEAARLRGAPIQRYLVQYEWLEPLACDVRHRYPTFVRREYGLKIMHARGLLRARWAAEAWLRWRVNRPDWHILTIVPISTERG